MPKTIVAAQAAVVECAISSSAPRARIQLSPSHSILEEEMAIVRDGAAWFGHVQPEDSQHVSFIRHGKRYLLREGEFSLYRRA